MKIMVVVGTRPEVIKLAPVIEKLKENFEIVVCSTGQHREMLSQALDLFKIKPDLDLNSMVAGQTLNELSAKILLGIDSALKLHTPDWVVVQGDTTTAFCASLAAFYSKVKIAHVEAGLRTYDLKSPFPEEGNRAMLAKIANVHFAPTLAAKDALIREGLESSSIVVTGNTVIDSLRYITSTWVNGQPKYVSSMLRKVVSDGPVALVTCHRRENFGGVIVEIAQMIKTLAEKHEKYRWIFPVHLNPGIRIPVTDILKDVPNVYLIDPVDYETNLFLIKNSEFILTDSGGIQEEAPSFGVPVIVMRSHSERMEGVNAGFAKLAGQDPSNISREVENYINQPIDLKNKNNPYGDGKASERMLNYFLDQSILEFDC